MTCVYVSRFKFWVEFLGKILFVFGDEIEDIHQIALLIGNEKLFL